MKTSASPLISVIVPVYNARPYLQRCFEALQHQTYTHLEVLFVDDCSTDGSYEECLRLCQTDLRFRTLRMSTNSGAGDVRRTGIEQSTGELIGFVDADDLPERELFATLQQTLSETGADIACCNAFYALEGGRRWPIFPTDDRVVTLTPGEALLRMHRHDTIGYSLWDKLFRRDIVLSTPLRTQPFEDQAALPYFFHTAQRIALRLIPLYNYMQHEESLMHGSFNIHKEFAGFELYYRETRMLERDYGVTGLNTVVKKGVHYLNHLCLVSPTPKTEELRRRVTACIREYDEVRIRPYSLGLRLKRYLLLNHYNAYRRVYAGFMRLLKPAKYAYYVKASTSARS